MNNYKLRIINYELIRNWKLEIGNSCVAGLPATPRKARLAWRAGATLIELLLYVAIIAMLMMSLVSFAWNIIEGGAKSATQQELYSQSRYLTERLKYEIRTATAINTGTSNFSSNLATNPAWQLSLTNPTNGTTLIKVTAAGIATITYGGSARNLNSADTKVTDLTFANYTGTNTDHIGFTLTLQSSYTGMRKEYQGSVSLRSSAELRSLQ